METKGASAISLDGYLDHAKIQNVSFIQMDVDGNECNVLLGSKGTLMRQKPLIIMELAPCLAQEYDHSVEELFGPLRFGWLHNAFSDDRHGAAERASRHQKACGGGILHTCDSRTPLNSGPRSDLRRGHQNGSA